MEQPKQVVNPTGNSEFADLKKQVAELQQRVDDLSRSSTIPYEVSSAFAEVLGTVSASSTGLYVTNNIRRSAAVVAGAVSVLEDPAGYIAMTFRGVTYKVPFFDDN